MKWRIIAVGKPSLGFARDGIAEYVKRLRRYASGEIIYIREAATVAATGERLLKASEGCFRIVLDERGDLPDTPALRERFDLLEREGIVKTVAFLVGGADGHAEAVRAAADWVFALGRLTFQHELALVTLLEQLYRVQTLKKGEPYHR